MGAYSNHHYRQFALAWYMIVIGWMLIMGVLMAGSLYSLTAPGPMQVRVFEMRMEEPTP